MDVSNLYVKVDYTRDLGMRIPVDNIKVSQDKNIKITLESIVENCVKK